MGVREENGERKGEIEMGLVEGWEERKTSHCLVKKKMMEKDDDEWKQERKEEKKKEEK